ncbi:093abd15-fbbe-4936-8520-ccbb6e0e6038-CDS [Sclerotinia trifoliorum]|uniref:093abd15-fbbe-4936-8520-ccbb6e0e6038-CDS n=1 Tax=Sclerotinia trifoliorum TaxID=28548 RepID=A0A8H2ZM99_9HELO|nr:093abd15-fbbe-4936-8520-ccbb6e0e6038-CDS [Sclerotinia trifoliorum]
MISNIQRKKASSSSSFSSSLRERDQNTSSSSNSHHQPFSQTSQSQQQYEQYNPEQNTYRRRHRNSSATNWSITSTILNEVPSYQQPSRTLGKTDNHLDPDSYEAFMQNALEEEHRRERHERAARRANDAWQQGFRRPDDTGVRCWLQGCGLAK